MYLFYEIEIGVIQFSSALYDSIIDGVVSEIIFRFLYKTPARKVEHYAINRKIRIALGDFESSLEFQLSCRIRSEFRILELSLPHSRNGNPSISRSN